MLSIPGYQELYILHENLYDIVYIGYSERDQKKVILKVLKQEYPSQEQLLRFYNEFEITSNFKSTYIRKPIRKERTQGKAFIVFSYINGRSLKELFPADKKIDLERFFNIAIEVIKALVDIESNGIIHRDFNSNNILYDENREKVYIIDFGISTKIKSRNHYLGNPDKLEGTLIYMSPEQTGRMNRAVDYRTDLYSLGISLYELISGKLPFIYTDSISIIHAHMAIKPTELMQYIHSSNMRFNKKIPNQILQDISNVIMRLIEKNAEDRYQSASGLLHDFNQIKQILDGVKTESDFKLAEKDFSTQFKIPEKLYGRQEEIRKLLESYRTIAHGEKPFILISGHSGVGKSALVHEIHKPSIEIRGLFIEGKFDQYQKNIPYSAWIQSFQELVKNILTENEESLSLWRTKILDALGSNGKVLTEIIPNLELIIGVQPEIIELGPIETLNRFNTVICNFIQYIAKQEHPLAIFIDDWQWADSASLELLKIILLNPDISHLLIICAYRENEVDKNHPFAITLSQIQIKRAITRKILVSELSIENIDEIVFDSLGRHHKILSNIVHRKTKGNAFFVNQFLNSLYNENLINIDLKTGEWYPDLEAINALDITDNVVDLISIKAKRLPFETLELLKYATCIGNQFEIGMLSIICSKSSDEIVKKLEIGLIEGFILHTKSFSSSSIIYKFGHDRIQQAIYSLIGDKERNKIHLQIGTLIYEASDEKEREERIFDITNQLNAAKVLIKEKEKIFLLANLNLQAAKKAKLSTAYESALNYIKQASSLMIEADWDTNYSLVADIYIEKAEIKYLNGYLDKSVDLIQYSLNKVRSPIEKGELYNLLIVEYTLSGKYKDAINAGLDALRLLGVILPSENYSEALEVEMKKINERKGKEEIKNFVNFPPMTSKEIIVAMKLLNYMVPPAFMTEQPLFLFIAAKMVNLSIEYGNTGESSYGYAVYGIVLVQVLKDYIHGYEFGAMALELSIKLQNDVKKCLACEVLVGHLNHWHKPIHLSQYLTEIGFKSGVNSGELQFAGYIYLYQAYNRFFEGTNLNQYIIEMNKFIEFTDKTKNQHASDVIKGCKLFAKYLSEPENNNNRLEIQNHFINAKERQSNLFVEGPYYTFQSLLSFLEGDYRSTVQYAGIAEEKNANVPGVITIAETKFYKALGIIGIMRTEELSNDKKIKYKSEIESIQKEFKTLSEVSVENFYHKYILVKAELEALDENIKDAIYLYHESIQSANENDFIHNEAIACELASNFLFKNKLNDIAEMYLQRAFKCYKFWGANSKIESLQKLAREIDKDYSKYYGNLENQTEILTRQNDNFDIDINSILKATQSLSGEILIEKLLTSLVQIIIENASAEKGFLILADNDHLLLEIEANSSTNTINLLKSIPIHDTDKIPISLVQYVYRTGENIVLYDAQKIFDGSSVKNGSEFDLINKFPLQNDPYFNENRTRAILCLPLKNHGKTIGIIYLENNLVPGVFNKTRLEAIKILCVQAAISIENARFYEGLDSKVKERTKELNSSLQIIKKDLLIAKKIQQNILPLDLEKLGPLKITIQYLPMTEVGGDFFDITEVKPNLYRLFVADATGHGVQAALVTMAIKSEYENVKLTVKDPMLLIDILNRSYHRKYNSLNSFFTCIVVDIDINNGKLRYASAGHPEQVMIQDDKLVHLVRTGRMIGLSKSIKVEMIELNFHKGDKLLLFTDGVFEEFNSRGDLFGEDYFHSLIDSYKIASSNQIVNQIITEVKQFIQKVGQEDDITFLGIEY